MRSGGIRPENARIRRSSNRPERMLALNAYWPTCSQDALLSFAGVYLALCVEPSPVFACGAPAGPLSFLGFVRPAVGLLLSPSPLCVSDGDALAVGGTSGGGAAAGADCGFVAGASPEFVGGGGSGFVAGVVPEFPGGTLGGDVAGAGRGLAVATGGG